MPKYSRISCNAKPQLNANSTSNRLMLQGSCGMLSSRCHALPRFCLHDCTHLPRIRGMRTGLLRRQPRLTMRWNTLLVPFLLASLLGIPPLAATAAAPAFVQVASAIPQSTAVSSVVVKYKSAQTSGNTNVVIVGWNDTIANVNTVTDTSGNSYALAVGPTAGKGVTQSIYYATNIAAAGAGLNTVTVKFTNAAAYPDVRILEYSGIDPASPLDGSMGAQGNGPTSSTAV